MNPIQIHKPAASCPQDADHPGKHVPLAGLLPRFLLLAAILSALSPPALQADDPPNRWIPLPYFQKGSWWLPVDPEEPIRIDAEQVSPIGNDCYLVSHGKDKPSQLMNRKGRVLLSAANFEALDGDRFFFSNNEFFHDDPCGIVNSDGRIIRSPGPPLQNPNKRRQAVDARSQCIRDAKPTPRDLPPLFPSDLDPESWQVTPNHHVEAEPISMSYCAETDLLAVVQAIIGGGAELRIWDLRSRCCVWRRILPGSPAQPVSVHLLPMGRVLVTGGNGKHNYANYLNIYDLRSRKLLTSHKIPSPNQSRPNHLQVHPIEGGKRILTLSRLSPEADDPMEGGVIYLSDPASGKVLRRFGTWHHTRDQMGNLASYPTSMAHLPGTDFFLAGDSSGRLLRFDLESGSTTLLAQVADASLTVLDVDPGRNAWLAGTVGGQVFTGTIDAGAQARNVATLPGEIIAIRFLRNGGILARSAGNGYGFFGDYSVSIGPSARSLIITPDGTERKIPSGIASEILSDEVIAIGTSDGCGVSLVDLVSGNPVATLAQTVPQISGRGFFTGGSIDQPEVLRTNRDGSQLLIKGRLFDFAKMSLRPETAARNLQAQISDVWRIDRLTADGTSSESAALGLPDLQIRTWQPTLMRIGQDRQLAAISLSGPASSIGNINSISPSGHTAAIWAQWKGEGLLRLIDLTGKRVISALNRGRNTEDLLNQRLIPFTKPLDDDGRRLLVVHNSGTTEMLDYAAGRTISRLDLGVGEASAACCSPEARRIFILTGESEIHCITWDDQGGLSLLGRLEFGVDDTWTAVTPDGLIMTHGSEAHLALAGPDSAQPLDSASAIFNRPHEIAARFGAEEEMIALLEKAFRRRCKRDGIPTERAGLDRLPSIELVNRLSLPYITDADVVDLQIKATGATAPLARLRLFVNNVPILQGSINSLPSQHSWSGDVTISLSQGDNRIQVVAVDTNGYESLRHTTHVYRRPGPTQPDLYVVAIGVSGYADELLNLNAAARDATGFIDLMKTRQGVEFRTVHVLPILDADATRERILAAHEFLTGSTIDDQVIIMVAGHGFADAEELRYWFGTHDIDIKDVTKRGLAFDELEGLFKGLAARQLLLLMDTCFAGEFDPEADGKAILPDGVRARAPAFTGTIPKSPDGSFALMNGLFTDLRHTTGATVIAASGGSEFVYAEERPQGDNGVFTWCLLDGLETGRADSDGDGLIRVSELNDFIGRQVPRMTAGRQRPASRRLNDAADFIIGVTEADHTFNARVFLSNYLALGELQGTASLADFTDLFAEKAHYFGAVKTRAQIGEDEKQYRTRFPSRSYTLQADPKVERLSPDEVKVRYSIDFTADPDPKGNEYRSGSQKLEMIVKWDVSKWRINSVVVLETKAETVRKFILLQPKPSAPKPSALNATEFVRTFLSLTSSNGKERQFAELFCRQVDYFDSPRSRETILKEELAYHAKWPVRRLSLIIGVDQANLRSGEILLRYTMGIQKGKTSLGPSIHMPMEMRIKMEAGQWRISRLASRE